MSSLIKIFLLSIILLSISLFCLFFAPISLDEEVNFYAGKLVLEEKTPGQDFLYPHYHFWPHFYAWALKFFGLSIYSLRLAALFYLIILLILVFLIGQKLKKGTGWLAIALIIFQPNFIRIYLTTWPVVLVSLLILSGVLVCLNLKPILITLYKKRTEKLFLLALALFLIFKILSHLPLIISSLNNFLSFSFYQIFPLMIILNLGLVFFLYQAFQKNTSSAFFFSHLKRAFLIILAFLFLVVYFKTLNSFLIFWPFLTLFGAKIFLEIRNSLSKKPAQTFLTFLLILLLLSSLILPKTFLKIIQQSRLLPAEQDYTLTAYLIKEKILPQDKIITFSPLLAGLSQRSLWPKLETGQINLESVLKGLKNPQVKGVILTNNHFYQIINNREKDLELIKKVLKQNYYLAQKIEFLARFGFEVKGVWGYQGLQRAEIYLKK